MESTFTENRHRIHKRLRQYVKKGLRVIPCKCKAPLLKEWQNRGRPTEEEAEDWIDRYPDLNIGLVLGSSSGIVGVDVDGKEAWMRLQEISKGDLPDTWAFKTPGGGKRLLYKIPKGMVCKKWVESLDGEHSELALLGDGQQTILPPSVHPNGGIYTWIKDRSPGSIEMAPAPQWMLDLMTGQQTKKAPEKKQTASAEDAASPVLERLAKRCVVFRKAWQMQQQKGVSEEEWHLWVRLLISAGQPEAAQLFSESSTKHDSRSEKRIDELIEQQGDRTGAMVRCSTFGCDEEQMEQCFISLHFNDDDELTNSPGSFVRDMDTLLPPTDPIYVPYVQALEQVPDYDIDEYGNLCGYDRKGNPYVISNFVARPTMEVIRDDGVSEERTFRIEGVLTGGRPLPPVDVPAAEFAGMNWVLNHWGITASIRAGMGKKDLCRDAIQNMASDVVQHRIFTHLGWRQLDSGQWVYLHAGGCIGADHVSVEIEKMLERYTLPPASKDLSLCAKASLALLGIAPKDVTVPLLALVYLSPLVEVFKQAGLEPNFLLWLYGGTGSRKTSLSLVFLSHFGRFISKSPPASFKDTANALERRAFSTKDTLLLIDDYHPEASKYESQKMEQIAQKILRMYGDRIARGRLKSTTEFQKEYPPRGMALVTGEDLPTGQSSVARFLGVELLKDQVDIEKLTKAQNRGSLLAQSMTGYIQWLIPQMVQLPVQVAEEFAQLRNRFQEGAAHGRLGEAAAWLYIGYRMMLAYMQGLGLFVEETAQEMLGECERILTMLVHKQGKAVEQEQPAKQFVKALAELFATATVRVDPLKPACRTDLVLQAGEKIGWYDDQFYYLLPEATYNVVSRFLNQRGEVISVKERTLWKHLDEAKMIHTEIGSDGRVQRCPKKNIPRKSGLSGMKQAHEYRPRLLHLRRSVLEKESESEE
ncbi:bifunctional DNA primase/polymerase [Brevibacillus borstelensis]|uniref:bifunctional DNA primase/polymerase n=1 Tax=Brevibacillus borstelensis TaxID=45462 RepID=UPI002E23A2B1|nr:bifunctional DNA primase/polymerase [Brevibacillus borstelensis]